MPSSSVYEEIAATMVPKTRPQKRNVDLRKGEPATFSTTPKRMTEAASPMCCGAPKASVTSPFSLQIWGPEPKAAALVAMFSPQKTPPPTYLMPDETRPAPIIMTATPSTTGGNIFARILRVRGSACGSAWECAAGAALGSDLEGMKEMAISRKQATMQVPRKAP